LEWTERLKGEYKASPVAVDGHILFLNTEGLCTVVIAISRFEETATNLIPDTTLASPAISNGRIYLRGHKFLWCIGRK
jgi:outer membrane protein assembly factor BamB